MDHFYPLGRVGGFQYLDVDRADFSRASFVAKTRVAAIWASLHPFGCVRCILASFADYFTYYQGFVVEEECVAIAATDDEMLALKCRCF